MVRLFEQGLEPVELGRREILDVPVRERPQNEIRFPEPAAPCAQLQFLEPGFVGTHSKTRGYRALVADTPAEPTLRRYFTAAALRAKSGP